MKPLTHGYYSQFKHLTHPHPLYMDNWSPHLVFKNRKADEVKGLALKVKRVIFRVIEKETATPRGSILYYGVFLFSSSHS